MVSGDPLMGLMGWACEPHLLRRLIIYFAEGLLEACSLLLALPILESMQPGYILSRLLVPPLVVSFLKAAWSARLTLAYLAIRRDVGAAIRHAGWLHSRGFWSCSAAVFTCFACVLMVWHGLLLLLMLGYTPDEKEALAWRYLTCVAGIFLCVNWAFWRDFVHNMDMGDEPDLTIAECLVWMYKSRGLKLLKHQDLREELREQQTCVICLEDFKPSEDVTQLPCGHVFHPTCAHKWLCQDWRCPFRCGLGPGSSPKSVPGDLETGGQALAL